MMSISYLVGKILSSSLLQQQLGSNHKNRLDYYGLSMTIKSHGLPIGAGLGSSAAFSVAVAASCLRLQAYIRSTTQQQDNNNNNEINIHNESIIQSTLHDNVTNNSSKQIKPNAFLLEVINGWAYASEILLHGTPSGLDNTTSCYGGLVKFTKNSDEKFTNISNVPLLNIVLVNTKVPRSTKQLVASVKKLYDTYPEVVEPILNSIGAISAKFLKLINEYVIYIYIIYIISLYYMI